MFTCASGLFRLDHLAERAGRCTLVFIAAADSRGAQTNGRERHEGVATVYADGDGVTYPEETHVLTAQVR